MRHDDLTEFELLALSYYGKDAAPPTKIEISPKEEKHAFMRYAKRRTMRDRELLVRRYLCWAFGMAARYKGPRLDFDEAISVANTGLMEALERYNPKKGYRFTTYAFFIIRRHLIEAIVQTYPVKVSDHVRRTYRQVELSPEEAARSIALHEEPRTLEEFFDRLGETQTLESSTLHERPEDAPFCPPPAENPAEKLQHSDTAERVRAAVDLLPPSERTVLRARYLQDPPESFHSLSRRLHVSVPAVREIAELGIVLIRRKILLSGKQ